MVLRLCTGPAERSCVADTDLIRKTTWRHVDVSVLGLLCLSDRGISNDDDSETFYAQVRHSTVNE